MPRCWRRSTTRQGTERFPLVEREGPGASEAAPKGTAMMDNEEGEPLVEIALDPADARSGNVSVTVSEALMVYHEWVRHAIDENARLTERLTWAERQRDVERHKRRISCLWGFILGILVMYLLLGGE